MPAKDYNRANSRSLGAYHIATNTVPYNPQRKNNFTLIVHGLDNIQRIDSLDEDPEVIEDGQREIVLSLISCDVPSFSQSSINVNRGNSTIKFPGKPSFNELSISVYDYQGGNSKDTLLAWQGKGYNPLYDTVGQAEDYKKDCELLQLKPNGELIRYWEIKGAWLSDVASGNYSMDSGDEAQTIDAKITYDWAIMHRADDYDDQFGY